MGRRQKCKAEEHKYYVEDDDGEGRCKRCEDCSAGSGWNYTDIELNPPNANAHGDLECHTCHLCPPGYYRQHDSSQVSCSQCRRSCAGYNRYVGEECGGHTNGHCGSCLPGFYDPSRNNQQRCIPQPSTDVLQTTMTPQKMTRDMNPTVNVFYNTGHPSTLHHGAGGYIRGGAVAVSALNIGAFSVLLASVVCMAVVLYCLYRRYKRRTLPTGRSESMLKVISSVNSDLYQVNVEIGDQMEEKISQMEMDCEGDIGGAYAVTNDSKVHPELTPLMSQHGPECHHEQKKTAEEQQYYPSFKLDADSKYLTITAKHPSCYGEKIDNLFKYLEVSPQTDFGKKYLYELEKYEYADYILRVLIVWARKDGRFDVLCRALDGADLKEVSARLMQQYNSENTPATS